MTGLVVRVLLLCALVGAVGVAVWLAVLVLEGTRPVVAAVTVEPSTVTGCLPADVTVTLAEPAPESGVAVDLRAPSDSLHAPVRVTVPAGHDEWSFPVETGPVAAGEQVQVHATVGDTTASATFLLVPVEAADLGTDPSPDCLAGFTDHHGYGQPQRVGSFDAARIPEASGLAASRRNPGWLYIVDDEAPREIWALRPDGGDLHPIPIEGFVGRDTESLAVGPCGPDTADSCVYVGDIGDNAGRFPDVAILRFAEPDLPAGSSPVVADTIRVRYPDGPVDAEALLVDDTGVLAIVTKDPGADGSGAARLFTTPFADGTMVDHGPVALPGPRLPLVATVLGVVVTGGDHRDGRVLLRTYDHVVEYVAADPDAPLWTFPSWPAREVPAAREPQSEAVAFAADDCGYFTVSETVGDIWFTGCNR